MERCPTKNTYVQAVITLLCEHCGLYSLYVTSLIPRLLCSGTQTLKLCRRIQFLFPGPHPPSFPNCKQREVGRGPGNEAYLIEQTSQEKASRPLLPSCTCMSTCAASLSMSLHVTKSQTFSLHICILEYGRGKGLGTYNYSTRFIRLCCFRNKGKAGDCFGNVSEAYAHHQLSEVHYLL